jgi:hypothetical protein
MSSKDLRRYTLGAVTLIHLLGASAVGLTVYSLVKETEDRTIASSCGFASGLVQAAEKDAPIRPTPTPISPPNPLLPSEVNVCYDGKPPALAYYGVAEAIRLKEPGKPADTTILTKFNEDLMKREATATDAARTHSEEGRIFFLGSIAYIGSRFLLERGNTKEIDY